VDLHESLLGQLREAVVDVAQADAHAPGHLPLGQGGVLAQDLEQAVAYFVLIGVHGMNVLTVLGLDVKGKLKGARGNF